jgi:hypothetical protein
MQIIDLLRVRMLAEMPDSVADLLLEGSLQQQFLDGEEMSLMPPEVQQWVEKFLEDLDLDLD